MDGAQAALDRALRRNKSDDRLEAAERAREETTEALERESAEAHRLVSDFEAELKKVDNLTKDADLWLSRPIKRCMAKLLELDTHNLNREQKDVLNLLVSCHRNLRMISTDIKALARFQRRTAKARACLERVLSAGEGATISRTNHSREASRAESLTLSICSEAVDQVQGRHSILCAYMKLMRPPASERIVGALRDSFATRSPPFEEFDSLAHAWLEEWMHLTTILQAVFQGYVTMSHQSPSLLKECMKVVEVHENISEHYNRTCQQSSSAMRGTGDDAPHSMMPVLLQAAHAYREPRTTLDGKVYQVHDNLVDLFITTLSKAIRKRVVEVAHQGFYQETTGETRNVVLDALVEDLFSHQEDINSLFPPRYHMATTVSTLYSEHFAACLRDLMQRIKSTAVLGQGPHASQEEVKISNAEILSLITWIERFISGTLQTSRSLSAKDREALPSEDRQSTFQNPVRDTLNGELLSQLDLLRKLYVTRACAKLREWMQGICEKDKDKLKGLTVEEAMAMETPLTTPGPIDVFSAVQSELHTMLEEVSDPTLTTWSACSMAELILEHSEDYEKIAEGLHSERHQETDHPKSAAHESLRRMNSSPAAFVKSIHPLLGGQALASTHSQRSVEENQLAMEQYCIAANNCSIYHKECSEVVRLVQAKMSVWDLSAGNFIPSSLQSAQRSLKRFEDLMRSAILRFQRSETLAVNFLVQVVLNDVREVLEGLFEESWLEDTCRIADTVCATFHDYSLDISIYLLPDVYSNFLEALFDQLVNSYLSGLYTSYSDGRVRAHWKLAGRRDVKVAMDCVSLLCSLKKEVGLAPARQVKDNLNKILSELDKMISSP